MKKISSDWLTFKEVVGKQRLIESCIVKVELKMIKKMNKTKMKGWRWASMINIRLIQTKRRQNSVIQNSESSVSKCTAY